MVETVLVAGGAGYIGSALIMRLVKDTNFNVKVFDNLMYGGESLFPFYNCDGRFKFIRGDLRNFDIQSMIKDVDYVVNLAALVGEPICKKYPLEAKQINQEANLQLAIKAEEFGIKRYIFSSTCSNYGISKSDSLVTEEVELLPVSLYAETKVNSEKTLLNELPNLPVTVLRFATAYGLAARIRFDLLLHQFIRDAWKDKIIKLYGAQSWRPFVHVDDIARSIVTVLMKNSNLKKKDVFNVGSNDQNFQKITLAKMITDRFDAKIEQLESVKDPRDYKVSFDKINKELDYSPLLRPEQTIEQMANALESELITEKNLRESVNIIGE